MVWLFVIIQWTLLLSFWKIQMVDCWESSLYFNNNYDNYRYYEVMKVCWKKDQRDRPRFDTLITQMDDIKKELFPNHNQEEQEPHIYYFPEIEEEEDEGYKGLYDLE